MVYSNAPCKKQILQNCLFCSKDEIICFFLSFRTSFLEPTTHEILSTFIPSEGSSSKVEEVGEVFCSV